MKTYSIISWIRGHADRMPNHIALETSDKQYSYATLIKDVDNAAAIIYETLQLPKPQQDIKIGICLKRSYENIVALLSIFNLGLTYVPIEPNLPGERKTFIIKDADIDLLIVDNDHYPQFKDCAVPRVLFDKDLAIGSSRRTEIDDYDFTRQNYDDSRGMYVIYTSGTTGTPKGVLIRYDSYNLMMNQQHALLPVRKDARVLQISSMSFDAFLFELGLAFRNGSCLIVEDYFSILPGEALEKTLIDKRVTHLTIVPGSLERLNENREYSLQCLFLAGEKCTRSIVSKWLDKATIFNLYGPTESTIWATYHQVTSTSYDPPIGIAVPGIKIYVLDDNHQKTDKGMLYLGGEHLAACYLNNPTLTAEKFIPDPFSTIPGARMYKTGDIVQINEAGELEYIGREDTQVKLNGYRIELAEIESQLQAINGIENSFVEIMSHKGEKQLIAFYTTSSALNAHDIIEILNEKLPLYMIPNQYIKLETLPLTISGKVDRKALIQHFHTVNEKNICEDESLSPEEYIGKVWKQYLGIRAVNKDTDFHQAGGNSLKAMSIINAVRDRLKIDLPLKSIFVHSKLQDFTTVALNAEKYGDTAGDYPKTSFDNNGLFPLSPEQNEIIASDLIHNDGRFNSCMAYAITGPVTIERIQEGLRQVFNEQPALRLTFVEQEGKLYQTITHDEIKMETLDFTNLPAPERDAVINQTITDLIKTRIDPFTEQIAKVYQLKADEDKVILLLIFHHAIWDGASSKIFIEAFNRAIREQNSTKPAINNEFIYGRYAYREIKEIEETENNEQSKTLIEEAWRNKLKNIRPIPFPQNPANDSITSYREYFTLDPVLTQKIRTLCMQNGITQNSFYLTVYAVLLFKMYGESKVLFEIPVSKRDKKEYADVIGCFVRLQPFLVDLTENPDYTTLTKQVMDDIFSNLNNNAPTSSEVLKLIESPDEQPPSFEKFFTMIFAYNEYHIPPLEIENTLCEEIHLDNNLTKKNIVLSLWSKDTQGEGCIVYKSDIFTHEQIAHMITDYTSLLNKAVDNFGERILLKKQKTVKKSFSFI